MSNKIPYEEEPKKRGRKPGSKNKPGHNAGRPRNGNGNGRSYGAVAPKQGSSLSRQKLPPTTDSKPVYANDIPKSGPIPGCPIPHPIRVAYDTPMPPPPPGQSSPPQTPAGGNGNGNGCKPRICDNPLPNLPAKPIQKLPVQPSVMASVCQSGENPDLITPEQLIKEIQKIATFEIRMLVDEYGCPLQINELSDQAAAAISSYSASPIVYEGKVVMDPRDPEGKRPLYKSSLSCWNKSSAHDQLMKWHGLYAKDKTPINAQFNQYNQTNISGWDLSKLGEDEIELLLDLRRRAVVDLEAQAG